MSEKICYIDFSTLENFMRDVFIANGVPADDAAVCANVLITADKLGIDSHGIGRLKPIYIDFQFLKMPVHFPEHSPLQQPNSILSQQHL